MPDINIQMQWHQPDACFAVVFVRDGAPWYLSGVLVGMSDNPGDAVNELFQMASEIVIQGGSYHLDYIDSPPSETVPVSLADRKWLFSLLDGKVAWNLSETMFHAIKKAESEEE